MLITQAELKAIPELKTFEKCLRSKSTAETRSPTKSNSRSMSPKKGLLNKGSKAIQKVAKLPAKKQAMITKRKGRKAKI